MNTKFEYIDLPLVIAQQIERVKKGDEYEINIVSN